MKAAQAKSTTATASSQTMNQAQPFFQKGGVDSTLVNEQAPFFSAKQAIQTKLTVGQPGDKYEQEADQMADIVVQKLSQPDVPSTQQKQASVKLTPLIQQQTEPENAPEQGLEAETDEVLQKSLPLAEA